MRSSRKKLASLRAGLHRQALLRLGLVEERLQSAETTRQELGHLVTNRIGEGNVRVAFLELSEAATRATERTVQSLTSQRAVLTEETSRRATERRQAEKLVERADAEAKNAEQRQAQRFLDEWAQSRWGRK